MLLYNGMLLGKIATLLKKVSLLDLLHRITQKLEAKSSPK